MTHDHAPAQPPGPPPPPAQPRGIGARREPVIWLLLAAFLVFMQWPMLKGWYYRASGAPPPSAVAWRVDFDAALAEARQTGRLVLVDVSADWCPPCIAMKHDVWSDAEVGRQVAASYVPLLVDADRDDVVSPRYGVSGIPAVLVLDGNGQLIRRASYLPRSGMLRFLAGD